MSFKPETRELAFQVWYACGQTDTTAARIMDDEHGYVITSSTIGEWKSRYGWLDRATRMDLAKQQVADDVLNLEETLLQDLLTQKTRYDRYFESMEDGTVDTQAMYAYTKLCGLIRDLHKEIKGKEKVKASKGSKEKQIVPQRPEAVQEPIKVARPEIKIDVSKLQNIRDSAEASQNRLLVDE
jgi:Zn-dependent M32 family carboxypeptidase